MGGKTKGGQEGGKTAATILGMELPTRQSLILLVIVFVLYYFCYYLELFHL